MSERRCGPGGMDTRCLRTDECGHTRNRRQRWGNARVITTASPLHKRLQHACTRTLLDAIPKRYNINSHIILLQPLRKLDHPLLILPRALQRGRNEHDYALAEVLVFAVLERELGDGEGGGDVDGAGYFGGSCVDGGDDLAKVFCVCYEDFGAVWRYILASRLWICGYRMISDHCKKPTSQHCAKEVASH